MKNQLLKSISLLTFVLCLGLTSCSNEENDTVVNKANFGNSVAMLNTVNEQKSSNRDAAMTITLVNFNPDYTLQPKYKINDIEFCDNGLFNDSVAGDGVYTSVETLKQAEVTNKSIKDTYAKVGSDFKYLEEFKTYIRSSNTSFAKSGPEVSISVGCDIVTRPCPQTTWYNTCIFSDECTCVYLENCEASIEVSIGL